VRHDNAWRIPSRRDESEYGVLVQCGPPEHPYWWLLCPVTATLYFDRVDAECNDAGCMWDDVHEDAAAFYRSAGVAAARQVAL
jgi:hypothetical protein